MHWHWRIHLPVALTVVTRKAKRASLDFIAYGPCAFGTMVRKDHDNDGRAICAARPPMH